jgi:uncharacterized protein Smg (DUF494 family)
MSNTHILDLIVKLVHHIQLGNSLSEFDAASVSDDHRYNEAEVSAAYSWVLQRTSELKAIQKSQPPRVLHIAEKMVLGKEAWGWLLELQNLGLVDHQGIERIIERIMIQYQGKVTLPMIKEIVGPYLLESDRLGGSKYPGLKGNESIN